ncbi:MAG: hypothetical protein KJ950_03080 [Proteobacteria bacterium]|nr:hypothetical protein [Pseudomonadota bacterium]
MELIDEYSLDNGIHLSIFEKSKLLAGDRWQVVVEGQAVIPLSDDLACADMVDDPEMLVRVREVVGAELIFPFRMERHFVAELEKEEVLAILLSRVRDTLLGYLGSPLFPERLLKKKCQDAMDLCRNQTIPETAEDDADGPADFSSCFRDEPEG